MSIPWDYEETRAARRSARPSLILLAVGFLVVLIAGGALVWLNFEVLWIAPYGSRVHPRELVVTCFGWCIIAFMLVLILATVALIVGWRWKRVWTLALVLVVFGFAPFVVAGSAYQGIIAAHHLEEAE